MEEQLIHKMITVLTDLIENPPPGKGPLLRLTADGDFDPRPSGKKQISEQPRVPNESDDDKQRKEKIYRSLVYPGDEQRKKEAREERERDDEGSERWKIFAKHARCFIPGQWRMLARKIKRIFASDYVMFIYAEGKPKARHPLLDIRIDKVVNTNGYPDIPVDFSRLGTVDAKPIVRYVLAHWSDY